QPAIRVSCAAGSSPAWPTCSPDGRRAAEALRPGRLPRHARRRRLVALLGEGGVAPGLRDGVARRGRSRPDPPDPGLADLHRVGQHAGLRSGDVAARGRRACRAAVRAHIPRPEGAAAGRAGVDVPLRHGLDGEERALGRRAPPRRARPGGAAPGRACARVRLGGGAVRRLPHPPAGVARRRDARLRDGREAAAEGARRSAAARHPGDVRLQEREVAERDQRRPAAGERLLGAARLRPRRVGRPLEWVLVVSGRYVRRFSRTERALHWVNALGFLMLLATGLILYLPILEVAVGRRPLMKDLHFWSGIGWVAALALVALLGDRRGLLRTARELDLFDQDDRRWLRGGRTPQGRFNAGQKVNAALTAAFTLLFFVSGLLLWLGERDTRFRFASTVILHDGLMYAALVLLAGHLYLAVIHPATRHALRGITLGTVSEEWAGRHHGKWRP